MQRMAVIRGGCHGQDAPPFLKGLQRIVRAEAARVSEPSRLRVRRRPPTNHPRTVNVNSSNARSVNPMPYELSARQKPPCWTAAEVSARKRGTEKTGNKA